MRTVRVIERAEEIPQVRELWEEAASCARAEQARAAAPTLFQSYEWNEIATRVFAEREKPYVVVAESDSGAAIIPACVRRDSASLLGEELFDYRDVIAAGDESLLEAAWAKIAELEKPFEVKALRGERGWAEMRPFAGAPYLSCSVRLKSNKSLERNLRLLGERGCVLRAQSSGRQGLKPLSNFSGEVVHRRPEGLLHPAEAGCSPGSAALLTNNRKQRSRGSEIGILRYAQDDNSEEQTPRCAQDDSTTDILHPAEAGCPRGNAAVSAVDPEQRSCAEEKGILRSAQDDNSEEQIPRCARNDNSEVGTIVRRMYELKGRLESGTLFRDPLRIEAVVQMAASAPTEVFTIDGNGELVAAVLTFIDGDVCRFYGTYYDERWAMYSPGVSLLYRVIRQAQARGLDFDFMTGEQAYKMRFASEVVPLYTAHVPVAVASAA